MARIVPDNPVAFPPSMEVSVGGRANQDEYRIYSFENVLSTYREIDFLYYSTRI
jgi:hypothetical protein